MRVELIRPERPGCDNCHKVANSSAFVLCDRCYCLANGCHQKADDE